MQAAKPRNSNLQKSKSVPKKARGSPRKGSPRRQRLNGSKDVKQRVMAPIVSSRQQAQAAAGNRSMLQETFQVLSEVDSKLSKGKTTVISGLFDEDAHNAKRQILLKRAAEAKKRIEAQNAETSLQKKPNFELIEDQLELESAENLLQARMERKKEYKQKTLEIAEKKRRKWMVQQGKSHMLDFQDDQIRKLKECFNSLDDDGSGSIGVDEIKGPLIGLGLVDTVEEVENLVELVDEDGSGMIEFGEFLDIILNKSGDAKARVITDFFKNLTQGRYQTNGLAFPNWVLKEQRSHLKNAIVLEKQDTRRSKGVKIMNALTKMRDAEGRARDAESDEELM